MACGKSQRSALDHAAACRRIHMRALKVSEPKAKRSGSVRPVFTTGFLKPGPGPPRAYLGQIDNSTAHRAGTAAGDR